MTPIPATLLSRKIEEQNEVPPVYSRYSQNAKVLVFGKPKDWKINENLLFLIPILKENDIEMVFLQDTSDFNASIASSSDFVDLFEVEGMKFFYGIKADGMIIPKKSAAIFHSADCPTIVLHDIKNDLIVGAHAGLESLIDKKRLTTGVHFRDHESVIDEIVRLTLPYSINHYEIFVFAGISSQNFIYDIRDPVYKKINLEIFSYLIKKYGLDAVPRSTANGNISLLGIIKSQFQRYGFDPNKIVSDDLDTFSNDYLWSHREEYLHGNQGWERNCVLVIHK